MSASRYPLFTGDRLRSSVIANFDQNNLRMFFHDERHKIGCAELVHGADGGEKRRVDEGFRLSIVVCLHADNMAEIYIEYFASTDIREFHKFRHLIFLRLGHERPSHSADMRNAVKLKLSI